MLFTTQEVHTRCPICQSLRTLTVSREGYHRWKFEGELIQRAFPELSEDDREALISGTCSKCWESLFKEEE